MSADRGTAPVLVVLVNNEADWRRVANEGWYRIPLRRAPRPVAASYLAFYLTRVFADDAFQVRYLAPVLRYQIATRAELLPCEPAHPRARERYYRIALGPIQELTPPIPSRRLRRITFIPTTWQRLHAAAEINDLWLAGESETLAPELFPDAAIKATRRLRIDETPATYCSGRRLMHNTRTGGQCGCAGSESCLHGTFSSLTGAESDGEQGMCHQAAHYSRSGATVGSTLTAAPTAPLNQS